VLTIPPKSPKKKNGLRNIPVIREPTVVRKIETSRAYFSPKITSTQRTTAFDRPNLNQGIGFGIRVSSA